MNPVLMSFLGGLFILDKYAIGEFGLSQPIIAGTILGAIFGEPKTGIMLGAVIQLIFLGGLPIGRDIPPDAQGAGIVGVGTYLFLKNLNPQDSSLFLAIVLALTAALAGGAMEIYTRRLNEKLYHQFLRKKAHLYLFHYLGLGTAYIRGFILFFAYFIFARYFIIPGQFLKLNPQLLLIIGIGAGIANGCYLFIKKRTLIFFIVGGLCSLALLVL
ncbi:hypothetical protein BXT86_04300 [candidate division WOR-3 bacterium 4484_100]|uniref:Uncharacterized protein n=1 Tax=candidate division WOR-3 bacterium 4484_100 TaxID=1936077 RepID=A0A1V4QG74_UNCW3|nr:MAG: hypothetical protein BXT86_04300 [candidate division WOR-3 bacterium 4484_100]